MGIDRKAFRSLTCGLYVITSRAEDGTLCGCVVNTLEQVASDPAQVVVSINKKNTTTTAITGCERFCASVLSQNATMDLIGTFGFHTSTEIDKFADVEFTTTGQGLPCLVEQTLATFNVHVDSMVDVGTHIVFIGTVEDAEVLEVGTPLTYDYYHSVLKGKTPAKAASFNDGEANVDDVVIVDEDLAQGAGVSIPDKVGWRCKICGYTVEGYEDGLPEDWHCPMCGMGREYFEKVLL